MQDKISEDSVEWLNEGKPLLKGDKIEDQNGRVFEFRKEIGSGTLSNVYKITEESQAHGRRFFALKVPTNDQNAQLALLFESNVLEYLKNKCTSIALHNLSYYYGTLLYHGHHCIIMELLGPSVYSLLENNQLMGLSLHTIQRVMFCVFSTLRDLHSIGVMHIDIKPENILQTKENKNWYKLVDFHCSGIIGRPNPTYVQSRFFRAPEVLLRLDYNTKIDVWSLAATAFEMFVGVPLFPGDTEVQMLYLINKMLGPFPAAMIQRSPRKMTFFLNDGTMKPADRLAEENMEDVKSWNYLYKYDTIAENIMTYLMNNPNGGLSEKETCNRKVFIDLLEKCLRIDPNNRISAAEALEHPFFSMNFD